MRRFVIEYWFRTKWFEKDFDEVIIMAKSEKEAIQTLKNIKRRVFNHKILSETLINN